MKSTIIIALLFLPVSIYCQTENKLSKERFNFLYDSLSIEKQQLTEEKNILIAEIDSLRNFLDELKSKIGSARIDALGRKYGKEIGNRISQGQVWKGMTEEMLQDSWGKPDRINSNKEKWGLFTQWSYGDITYFFKDGVMIDWEEKN